MDGPSPSRGRKTKGLHPHTHAHCTHRTHRTHRTPRTRTIMTHTGEHFLPKFFKLNLLRASTIYAHCSAPILDRAVENCENEKSNVTTTNLPLNFVTSSPSDTSAPLVYECASEQRKTVSYELHIVFNNYPGRIRSQRSGARPTCEQTRNKTTTRRQGPNFTLASVPKRAWVQRDVSSRVNSQPMWQPSSFPKSCEECSERICCCPLSCTDIARTLSVEGSRAV